VYVFFNFFFATHDSGHTSVVLRYSTAIVSSATKTWWFEKSGYRSV